jgi:hypothetical protein
MIEWIFERLGLVIFLVIFVSQIVRALLRSRKAKTEHEAQRDESSEERRVREVQEQIRRQIAARRGGNAPTATPPPFPAEQMERPIPRAETTQLPELFGGPLGRMLEELQKRTQPPPPPPPPLVAESRNMAELERQEQLADQLKALEDSRATVQRRAANIAAGKQAVAESEPALRSAMRERALEDLSDPASLRRAFILREVLGTPVGLR